MRNIAVVISSGATIMLSAEARAQQPQVYTTNVHYQFIWTDIGGVQNGVLEPGESARIKLTIQMTPPVNSPATWNTVIGGSGTGVFRGLQAIFFDLVGSGGAQGVWSDLIVDELWDLVGPPGHGTPQSGGEVLADIQAGQFPAHTVNTSNPVLNIWQGTWTPSSYDPRLVGFDVANASSNPNPLPSFVIVRDPAMLTVILVGTSVHTSSTVQIPVVPAPPVAGGLVCAGLIASRRRRPVDPGKGAKIDLALNPLLGTLELIPPPPPTGEQR